jgi:hypothetical protein
MVTDLTEAGYIVKKNRPSKSSPANRAGAAPRTASSLLFARCRIPEIPIRCIGIGRPLSVCRGERFARGRSARLFSSKSAVDALASLASGGTAWRAPFCTSGFTRESASAAGSACRAGLPTRRRSRCGDDPAPGFRGFSILIDRLWPRHAPASTRTGPRAARAPRARRSAAAGHRGARARRASS